MTPDSKNDTPQPADPGAAPAADAARVESNLREKVSEEQWSTIELQPDGRPSTPHTERPNGGDTEHDAGPTTTPAVPTSPESSRRRRVSRTSSGHAASPTAIRAGVSEWSHQQLVAEQEDEDETKEKEDEWQTMPAYAPFDLYDDDGKLIAKEAPDESEAPERYATLASAAKGYTRVQDDEDAKSTDSMDENTSYLFKEQTTRLDEEDEEAQDVMGQLRMTKELLSDNQRIAYVGIVKLATAEMAKEAGAIEKTRGSRKLVELASEAMQLWGQKMMVRLYSHMELDSAEQVMIEQLAQHGLVTTDLTPSLMESSVVKNPMHTKSTELLTKVANGSKTSIVEDKPVGSAPDSTPPADRRQSGSPPPPAYQEVESDDGDTLHLQSASELASKESISVDLRWTVLCDLFLTLISDSHYDARSRTLLERVAGYLDVPWIDVCRFEKRVTEALEMEEEAQRDDLDEQENMEKRKKRARNRRLAYMGLATVGGGLVIGLSAGLLAPVIGAGLAAGFTTIGVTGTSGFLAGVGGAATIGSVATVTGGTVGLRASNRRTGAVKTFEYRPLHNKKRVSLIVTVSGWMTGKVDDVRLPFSTVDPLMGDLYSILWEPDMLKSTGQTINILATEALTQGLQQILGSTILIALMSALQLPILLTKLSYLIDNPWSVSVARADAAGLILADSLIERNLGARPITLVGFSLGSRLIFSCLKELAKKGALGLIQNVYLFGSPVVYKKDEYLRARAVVSGRFVNGYATNDWILGYLFRATGGGIMRVSGLTKVDIPGIENFDVTQFVPGHMAYRTSLPRLLRELGWAVTSDEFAEIEDPDPDNHDKRQRELIDEIEEARRELEKQPEKKKRFGIFSRSKKRGQKQDWEMYDESSNKQTRAEGGDPEGPLFDIDAIRREAVELAAEGIQIKKLESTLPPMKIDTAAAASSIGGSRPTTPAFSRAASMDSKPSTPRSPIPRCAGLKSPLKDVDLSSHGSYGHGSYFERHIINGGPADEHQFEQDEVTLSFEAPEDRVPSLPEWQINSGFRSASPQRNGWTTDNARYGSDPELVGSRATGAKSFVSIPPNRPYHPSHSPSPTRSNTDLPYYTTNGNRPSSVPLTKQETHPPNTSSNISSNPWADEDDDFGKEQELSMTFE